MSPIEIIPNTTIKLGGNGMRVSGAPTSSESVLLLENSSNFLLEDGSNFLLE